MTNNNNGEWKATQAERWGFLRAKLEDQSDEIKEIKSSIKNNERLIINSVDYIKGMFEAHLADSAIYRQNMEKRLTTIEVRSGILGTVSGFIGGLVGGFAGILTKILR